MEIEVYGMEGIPAEDRDGPPSAKQSNILPPSSIPTPSSIPQPAAQFGMMPFGGMVPPVPWSGVYPSPMPMAVPMRMPAQIPV